MAETEMVDRVADALRAQHKISWPNEDYFPFLARAAIRAMSDPSDDMKSRGPTHWMPLPDPPAEK